MAKAESAAQQAAESVAAAPVEPAAIIEPQPSDSAETPQEA
jgi:hypothetical protein